MRLYSEISSIMLILIEHQTRPKTDQSTMQIQNQLDFTFIPKVCNERDGSNGSI